MTFTITLPPAAFNYDAATTFDSDDSSDTQTETDMDDDFRHNYKVPFPSGPTLRVSRR